MNALQIIGGLSRPSKMPCFSYSLPALESCNTGKLLAENCDNSPCASCYATRGNYRFSNVTTAQQRRLTAVKLALSSDSEREKFVNAFVLALQAMGGDYFRFHDSGDLLSVSHLALYCEIVERLPTVNFWLPTLEKKIVADYNKSFPSNLCIRISSPIVGHIPFAVLYTAHNAGVTVSGISAKSYDCPSSTQGNKCLSCRRCWDKSEKVVIYKKH